MVDQNQKSSNMSPSSLALKARLLNKQAQAQNILSSTNKS